MVCSIFNTMSRYTEIIVAPWFCNQLETEPFKCRDIEKSVATLFSVHHLILCRNINIETLCRDINLPFQIEYKINYVAT